MKALIVDHPDQIMRIHLVSFLEKQGCFDRIDLFKTQENSLLTADGIHSEQGIIFSRYDETKADALHIFINLEAASENGGRQSQKAVEILIWLRCKFKVCNPVIFYGFQSNQQILKRKPKHFLINSEGCYYCRLPFESSKRIFRPLKGTGNEDVFKQFLRPAFNFEEIRHEHANWWGIKCMWDIYQMFIKNTICYSYPKSEDSRFDLNEKLDDLNFRIGTFLMDNRKTLATIKENTLEEVNNLVDKIKNHESEIDESTAFSEEYRKEETDILTEIQALLDKLKNRAYFYEETVRDLEISLKEKYEKLNRNKIAQQDEVRRFPILKEVIRASTEIKDNIRSVAQLFLIDKVDIVDVKNEFKDVKILLIDDQYNHGWYQLYSSIFFDELKHSDFKAIKSPSELSFKSQDSLLASGAFLPDLILLDLRLIPSKDKYISHDFSNLSGAKVLKAIRQRHKGIPVMITTASNKLWSFEELTKLGADAYWMKEGIDNNFTAEETLKNYNRFIWLTQKLTGKKYRLLAEWSMYVSLFDAKRNSHWSHKSFSKRWANGEAVDGNVAAIAETLKESVFIMKNYLHQYDLNYGYDDGCTEAFILSGLINKIAGTFEYVHRLKVADYHTGVHEIVINRREDFGVDKLRVLRNKCSHGNYKGVNWNKLEECITETKIYLGTV